MTAFGVSFCWLRKIVEIHRRKVLAKGPNGRRRSASGGAISDGNLKSPETLPFLENQEHTLHARESQLAVAFGTGFAGHKVRGNLMDIIKYTQQRKTRVNYH